MTIHVVIRTGAAVIAFKGETSYKDAMDWISGRSDSTLYTVNEVPLH